MNDAPAVVKMCASKATYFSKKTAQTVANARNRGIEVKYRQRSHVARRPVRAYQCDYCNYWHLTSSED